MNIKSRGGKCTITRDEFGPPDVVRVSAMRLVESA